MDDVTAGSDAGARAASRPLETDAAPPRGANCTVRVLSPLQTPDGHHAIGAFVQMPEDQAEELVALGVVEVMPEMPAAETGKKKKPA